MKDGRRAGNQFELQVCRFLSSWVSGEDYHGFPMRDQLFKRRTTVSVPVEGHWEGAGDVIHVPDLTFPFAVEAKTTKDWSFDGFFSQNRWPVVKYWGQACDQATESGLEPLLMLTRPRYPLLVCFPCTCGLGPYLQEQLDCYTVINGMQDDSADPYDRMLVALSTQVLDGLDFDDMYKGTLLGYHTV